MDVRGWRGDPSLDVYFAANLITTKTAKSTFFTASLSSLSSLLFHHSLHLSRSTFEEKFSGLSACLSLKGSTKYNLKKCKDKMAIFPGPYNNPPHWT